MNPFPERPRRALAHGLGIEPDDGRHFLGRAAHPDLRGGTKLRFRDRLLPAVGAHGDHPDEDGDDLVIKIFAATSKDGIVIELQADEGDDAAVTPIPIGVLISCATPATRFPRAAIFSDWTSCA